MTTTFPYTTQANGWSAWAESLLTEATQLTPATLMAGQSGGVLDDYAAELSTMRAAAERISDSAYTTAKVAGTQDMFDRALATAPSEGEVREAEHAAERVRLQQKYTEPRQGDQAILNRAGYLRADRDAAIKQHEIDTSTTQWPEVPDSGYVSSPSAPGGAPTVHGPNGIGPDGDEPPWGDEAEETPTGTRLSSGNTPTTTSGLPLMTAAQQQPQQSTTASPTSTTPGISPTAAWTPTNARPKPTIGDDDVRERPESTKPEATGTAPSADRGSTIHGVTTGDVSGKGSNMLGVTQAPGQANTASSQGRMGGMGMMPGMHGMGGQQSKTSRSGDRPEVLTSDPNLLGTIDDDASFDGGLIVSGDPRFDDVLYPEDRAVVEARENPHLMARR